MTKPEPHSSPRTTPPAPLVSVVTVVKNAADSLAQTMDSVLLDMPETAEYLVLDGGSTDSTPGIIEARAARLAYWHSRPDRGISDAFNQGIEHARGTFILLLNADDFLEPGILAEVSRYIEAAHMTTGVIHGGLRYIDESTGAVFERFPEPARIRRVMSIYHPTMFVARRTYQEVGGYDEGYRFAMDSEWVHRAISQGIEFHQLDMIVTNMRLHGTSYRNTFHSLLEFYQSTTTHFGFALANLLVLARQLAFQTLFKLPGFQKLWLERAR